MSLQTKRSACNTINITSIKMTGRNIRPMRLWIITLFALFTIPLMAIQPSDSIHIEGTAPDYAGMTLIVETMSQYMLNETSEIARIEVQQDGTFHTAFLIEEPMQCSIILGQSRGVLYTKPGETYKLALPPYEPLSDADRFNPFFEYTEVLLGILNESGRQFNEEINAFEFDYQYHFNTKATLLFSQKDTKLATSIKAELDSLHPSNVDSYLYWHKHFRYGRLFSLSMRRQKGLLINQYFSNSPVWQHLPAYWDTFNEVFKDFFAFYFQSPTGRSLRDAFNGGKSFDSLSLVLKTDTLYTRDDFRETVLIRALYDAFYSKRYDEQRIITLVKEATVVCKTEENRLLADRLYARINRLRIGTQAPPFTAINSNGKEKSLDDYKGKYVYLSFMNTQNYACKKQMQALPAIARELKRDLVVITILTDNNQDAAFEYIKKNSYKWEILHLGGNGKLLSDYNIKAMPMYYLIDPEGNISLSPSPSPEENFAPKFAEVLRNYLYQKERKAPEKHKSIYDL